MTEITEIDVDPRLRDAPKLIDMMDDIEEFTGRRLTPYERDLLNESRQTLDRSGRISPEHYRFLELLHHRDVG